MTSDLSSYTTAMYTKTAIPLRATNTGTLTTTTLCPVSSSRRTPFEERTLKTLCTIHGKHSRLRWCAGVIIGFCSAALTYLPYLPASGHIGIRYPLFLSSTSTPIWIVEVPSYFVCYYVDLHFYSDIIYNYTDLTVHLTCRCA